MLRAPALSILQVVPTFPRRGGKTAPSPKELDSGKTKPEREEKLEKARWLRSHAGPSALRFLPGEMATAAGGSAWVKEKCCISCFPLEFQPLLYLHFSNSISNSWVFFSEFLFIFLLSYTSYWRDFHFNFAKLCLLRTYRFHGKLFSPHKQPSLCPTTEKQTKKKFGVNTGMLVTPQAIISMGVRLLAALCEDGGCWKIKQSCSF